MLTSIHLYINEQRIAVTVNNCNNDDISKVLCVKIGIIGIIERKFEVCEQ